MQGTKHDTLYLIAYYYNQILKMYLEELSLNQIQDLRKRIEATPFVCNKFERIYYIPIFPRAYVDQIVGIDYDRRTVTANFTIYITISLKVKDIDIKNFIRDHLIVEFAYNQTIFIPETMKSQRMTHIIKRNKIKSKITIMSPIQFLVTLSVQLSLICFGILIVLSRTQTFNGYKIKYNAMTLMENNQRYRQFSPNFTFESFGAYRMKRLSTFSSSDENKQNLKKMNDKTIKQYGKMILNMMVNKNQQNQDYDDQSFVELLVKGDNKEAEDIFKQETIQQLKSFKHVTFKFELSSLKLAYILQNQIPIWVLSITSLLLFASPNSIGDKYENIILLLVTYIALISSFRINNVGSNNISLYQIKIMSIVVVPILLTISSTIDFYNPDYDVNRPLVENPFFLASMAIFVIFFFISAIFLVYMILTEICCRSKKDKTKYQQHSSMQWKKMNQFSWGNFKLQKKVSVMIAKDEEIDFEDYDYIKCKNTIKNRFGKGLMDTVLLSTFKKNSQPEIQQNNNKMI